MYSIHCDQGWLQSCIVHHFADGPWDHIQIDCSTHLAKSKDGYTALLVIIDVFTGFVILIPIRTTSAEYIAS